MERMSIVFHLMARRSRHIVVAHWLCGAEKWWQFLAWDLPCFLSLAHQWHWLPHLSRIAGQWPDLHWQCHEITWCWSAVWCCDGATNLWTIKIKSLYMLWSQYKSAPMRCSEFLRKQITGIPKIANPNSNFQTLQTLEFQNKYRPESLESKMEWEFCLWWGSQKSEPKIRIPNQALLVHVVLALPLDRAHMQHMSP